MNGASGHIKRDLSSAKRIVLKVGSSLLIEADGSYRFSGLDAGWYALKATLRRARREGKVTTIEKIELADRERRSLDLYPE